MPRCGTCVACRKLAALTREPVREFEALPSHVAEPDGRVQLVREAASTRRVAIAAARIDELLAKLGYKPPRR